MNARPPERPRPRVLVVDDDLAIRAHIAARLREDHCDVIEASNGRELSWFVSTAQYRVPIAVVVVDVRLLAPETLSAIARVVRVVLMGPAPDEASRRALVDLGAVFLDEPVDAQDVCRVVRELTGGTK